MTKLSTIVDTSGNRMVVPKNGMFAGAWNAGNPTSRNMECWSPRTISADKAMLREKPTVEGRAADLSRNNGFIAGAIQSAKDSIVGDQFRLQLLPEYRLLGLDIKQANAWATQVEGYFNSIADDPECFFDARRQSTFTQLVRESLAMDKIHGEAFYSREWRPSKSGFSTCFQSISPSRIDTPPSIKGRIEQKDAQGNLVRGGVVLDSYGAATSYYVGNRHPNDVGGMGLLTDNDFTLVNKYNEYNWLNIIHVFDRQEPNQTRGFSSLASVIQKIKMLDMLEDVELEASIIAATYAMVLEAAPDSSIIDALGDGAGGDSNGVLEYEGMRRLAGQSNNLMMGGVRIPHLVTGEKISLLSPNHPNNTFADFESAMLRHIARGLGTSYEQLSGDYTKTTYSSMRAAAQIAWQYAQSKSMAVPKKLATLMFRAWLDEAIVKGIIKPPAGIDYWAARAQLTKCNWIGAGRLIIDEVKAAKAAELRLNNNLSTMQQECADNGLDYQQVLDQLSYEQQDLQDRGLRPRIAESVYANAETQSILNAPNE